MKDVREVLAKVLVDLWFEEDGAHERISDQNMKPYAEEAQDLIVRLKAANLEIGLGWNTDMEAAPKCDLDPYDSRASEESSYIQMYNGRHYGVGYYQIDDESVEGGYWCCEDERCINPPPTAWKPLNPPGEG